MERFKRIRKYGIPLVAVAVIISIFFSMIIGSATPAFALDATSDNITSEKYKEYLGNENTTRYAGRVWTDKSVEVNDTDKDNPYFNITYSALAASQSISGQTDVPIDVVFVIDLSGSMSNANSGMDNGKSRIANTIDAVNDSIDKLMSLNSFTRIGIVGYSSTATTLLPLDHYNKNGNNNFLSLDRTTPNRNNATLTYNALNSQGKQVNGTIDVSGGTNTQMGMYQGMNLLASTSSTTVNINGNDINRVPSVILLSDGAATYSSSSTSWWAPANNNGNGPGSSAYAGNGMKLMMTASYMKDAIDRHYNVTNPNYATTVYTVGMGITNLSGNDKNLADISLNPANHWNDNNTIANSIRNAWDTYKDGGTPSVEVNNSRPRNYTFNHPTTGYDITSASDLNYVDGYYDANDASSVTNVFDDIVNSISINTPSVPTDVGNDPQHEGYITYTDPIGEYLQVNEVKKIEYNGMSFTNPTKSENQVDATTTYTFEGEVVSPVYGDQNLNSIIITVKEEANGLQTLTVKIPAALIPVRVNNIELNSDGSVKSHTNNEVTPIKVLYTVGAKDGVNFNTLEGVSKDYIDNHIVDGKVNFYSNLYTGQSINGKTVGDAKVDFIPAKTNPFYYIQENTPLYLDKDLTQKATGTALDSNQTYYFALKYYNGNELVTDVISRSGSEFSSEAIIDVDGQLNIKVGRARLGFLTDSIKVKEVNSTNTAEIYYYPIYNAPTTSDASDNGSFTVSLGNNGVISVEAFGKLAISKTVTADEGLTAPDNIFTFTVRLTDSKNNSLTGQYTYTITDSEGNPVTDENDVPITSTVSDGGTIALKGGQTATIDRLPASAKYEVTEAKVAGFTTTSNNSEGSIEAGKTVAASFGNHYAVTPVTLKGTTAFNGEKVLTGREWTDEDSFKFEIRSTTGAPLPEVTEKIVTKNDLQNGKALFNFDDVTYTKPGDYTYTIVERDPEVRLPGISYSQAAYDVKVTIIDNHDGTLSATSQIYMISDDSGSGLQLEVNSAAFTNKYEASVAEWAPIATKVYTDNSGQKSLLDDMFKFQMRPIGDNAVQAPMPEGTVGVSSDRVIYVNNIADTIAFKQVKFTQDLAGQIFTYEITEVNENKPGMTYDSTVYTVSVEVSLGTDKEDGTAVVIVTPTILKNGVKTDKIIFENSYTPTPVSLTEESNTAIHGTKTLNGRDMKDNESFDFTLVAADDTTKKAIDDNVVVINNAVSVSGGKNGVATGFNFGEATFMKPGTYTFNVKETANNAGGVTYDKHTCIVTVVVTDNNGKLEAAVTYNNGTGSQDNSQAVFTNTYNSVFDETTSVTLNGKKTLIGKELNAGEFYFTVEAQNNAPMGDSFETNRNEDGIDNGNSSYTGNISLLKNITYDKAGTYEYIIKEQIPSAKRIGITYDETVYKVTVEVIDDLNGNLKANAPVIEKIIDENTVEKVKGIEFNNTYEPLSTTVTPLKITKVLSGDRNQGLKENEFNFEMELVSANPTDGVQLPTNKITSNATDGTVQFENITFTKVGEYVIRFKEVIPDDANKAAGITYDDHVIESTFKVTDNNGQLVVTRTGTTGDRIFTNVYKTTGTIDGSTNLKVSKVLTGRDWKTGDSFTFKLSGNDDVTNTAIKNKTIILPENAKGITITNSSETKSVSFGNIRITKPGTYTFSISEDASNPINGITYDDAKIITVTATDNGDGTLTILVTGNSENELTFTNTYAPESVTLNGEANLKVTKELTGREWLDTDEFNFRLEAGDNKTELAIANNAVEISNKTLSINNENKDNASFRDIIFKEAGTYKFTITEVDGGITGITYDTTPRVIIVNVVDNEDGTMSASLEEGSQSLEFVNTYAPESTSLDGKANLEVTKNLTGREWLDTDSFTFAITANQESKVTVDAVKAGEITLPENLVINSTNKDSASFGNITFTKAGTYKFTVSEVAGKIPGVSYDSNSVNITVDVVDNKDGTMSASLVEGSPALAFVNTYAPDQITLDGKTNLKVTKNLTGRVNNEWTDGDNFGFILAADENDAVTKEALDQGNIILPENKTLAVTNDNKNNAYFDGITFKTAGTYKFTVKEIKGNTTGVSYDESVKNITVDVVDDNTGVLKASVIEGSDELTFNNTYAPLPVTLNGAKNLVVIKEFTGRANNEWLDSDVFAFNLTANDETTQKAVEANEVILGNTQIEINKNSKNTSFGNIEFTKPGEYTFKVAEVDGGIAGITYDTTPKIITVKAVDNNDGTMSINVKGNDDLTFTNTYRTEDVILEGKTNLNISKVLEGRNWNDTDSFEFELKASDKITKSAVEAGKIVLPETKLSLTKAVQTNNFGDITFKEPGEYTFEISETKGNIERIGYDSHVTTISVEVTDNTEGKLVVATPTVGGEMVFKNTYTPAPVTATLQGTKVMNGRDLKDTDKFNFTIEGTNNAPMPQITIVENHKDSISFAPITYTEAGTYEYTIRETGGTIASVTNDSGVVRATVNVTYDADKGILTPNVTYVKEGGNGEGFTFINKYVATPIMLVDGFSATKTVKSSNGNSYEIKGGEFEFMITPSQNNPTSDPIKETKVTNDVNGNITFATNVKYIEAGTYTYDVKEISGSLGGMSYDDTVYTITVKVTDNQNTGKLEAKVSVAINEKSVDSINFTNEYNPKAATAIISGKKVLSGKELEVDSFTFNLKSINNAPMPEKASTTNSAAGLVQFGEITYDKPGEYQYQVSEVNDGKEGYTYDNTVHNVTVKVTDVNGELKSEITNNEFIFNNSYKAKPVNIGGETNDIIIGAVKKLDGRKMNDKEFEFELRDQNNTVVSTAKNDAKGNLHFSEIRFEEAGTYYFTMIEKNNNLGGVTYDQNTYLLEVIVTDEGGHLGAKVRYVSAGDKELDTVVFKNSYQPAATSIQLGATKLLNGRDLKVDEFTFVLKDKNGKVVSQTSNTANGLIQFDKLNFDEVGTYQYTIAEVKSTDETVVYDDSVFTATVNVTDDGKGNLNAEIKYDKTPVFTNKVKAKDSTSVDTDDIYDAYGYLGALTVSMLGGMALYTQRKKRIIK